MTESQHQDIHQDTKATAATAATAATVATMRQQLAERKLYSTSQAAHVILGGTDTKSYWGFEFEDFTTRFQKLLCERIGNPLAAPWRKDIDFTTNDYVELSKAIKNLDFTQNPAGRMDEPMALEFAKRSNVLGVSGPIGSGKDEVGKALAPHGFVPMSFAEPLRVAGAMVYGVPMRYFTERGLKELPLPNSNLSPRRILQLMGTEVCREVCEPIWVKRTLLRMASVMHDLPGYAKNSRKRISASNGMRLVITDTRFQNEADFVRSVGGRVVRVSRPDAAKAAIANGAGHSSEAGFSDFPTDIHLANRGTLADFHKAAENLLGAVPDFEPAGSQSGARVQPKSSVRRAVT